MDITKIREEYASTLATAEKFAADHTEYTDEQKTEQDQRFARLDALKAKIDEAAKFAKFAVEKGEAIVAADPKGRAEYEASEGQHEIKVSDRIDRAEFGRALTRWAASGQMDRRFATITTSTASSILLPKSVLNPIATVAANAFREGFAAWGLSPLSSQGDTSTYNIPVMDPTAGGQVAENASSETENAPGMSESIVSTVKTYQSGSVYFSNLQLSATAFDLLGSTVPHLSANKELGLESVIAAAIIADSAVTQVVNTASTSAFTFANLVSLNNKLPKRYQQNKVILFGADAFSAAEGLVDDNGRPVMTIDAQNQSLRRIGGTPVVRCDYLEAFGASKVVGLIVSLNGFHLRDAGEGVVRYDQIPAKPNQTGINLFGYHAYGYSVSALAKLKTPSS